MLDFDALPAISGSNYRQALIQTPGLVLSEESTPLLSIGYRGLAPHRAQFTCRARLRFMPSSRKAIARSFF